MASTAATTWYSPAVRARGAAEAERARERGYKERRETALVTGESRELELEGLRL